MTDHRHLKRRVRERMSRTRESYSTARRQVLAQASSGPLPAGLVPGYDMFGAGGHRLSSLVGHLLRQAGHVAPHTAAPYSEAMVCGLGGGIGFMYATFEYTNIPPLVTIVAQHHPEPWLAAVLARLGIGSSETHSGSVPRALAQLRADLELEKAALCLVDRSALPWHSDTLALASDPYQVVVAGAKGDILYLDDVNAQPHPISEDDFARAWSGYKKGRHHRVTVDRPAKPVDLPAAIATALAVTVAHLTGPVLGNSFDVNFGFSGMTRLAAQLRDERTKSGWVRRFADPGAYAWALLRLYECVELEYTAAGATRPLYADFLDEAAVVLGKKELARAAELFRQSGQSWSKLADLAAETADDLPEVTELARRRMTVVMTMGRAGAEEIKALSAAITAADAPGPDPAVLGALAELVDTARTFEEQAVALLAR
ncbi:hypothetical protein Rhe02_17800 [Rhizocola hellebori]|uniref:DUF4872 domain-containing protein n=2 Tax=Rhizocola hellebori TaxID=1392758 RepID=A0A8J3Q5L4_9ACTN|nr:hypothetical protein Rhe02_17800 [Rhizocola hellebori]